VQIGIMDMTVNRGGLTEVTESLRHAATTGAESFWVPNFFGLDALTALAIAGVEVPAIRLGTAVVPIFGRHPRVLAQQARTVDVALGGRLTLGVGLSHRAFVDGIVDRWPASPVQYLDDYLEALTELCAATEPPPDRAPTTLRVLSKRPLPVLVAALGPRTLEVAGRRSDGVVLWCTGYRTIREVTVPILHRAAAQAGREQPRVVVGLPVCVTDDPEGVRGQVDRQLGAFDELPSYQASLAREGIGSIAELAAVGSTEEILEVIDRYQASGTTELLLNVVGRTDEEREATWDLVRTVARR
jgi:5,10-methylenetetrahydromethanopterin reductase